MKRDYNPVDVELSIENPSIERGAFYRLCFITESNIAPRTLKVTRLQDLLDNGYSRLDLAYNFCVGVFSQQGIDTVYIRAKRSFESYVEAYNSDDNSMYYFVVLQTKDLTEIKKFNSHLVSSDEMKLQFFSQNVGSRTIQSPKLVNYHQDYTCPEGGVSSDDRNFYLNSAYGCSIKQIKLSLPDYLLSGLGDTAIDYGVHGMVGSTQIWEIDSAGKRIKYKGVEGESWKYLPIFDVAVQVKRNSIAGHAESIEAVNNSLPFVIPNYESYVTITGIAKVGEILTATVTDKNGVPSSINHQWYASGEAISGATSKTYTLKTAQAGKVITVKAEYTDIDGYVESVTSAATEVVKPVEIVDEGVSLKDFDFAVVKYQWSDSDGTDLDTRTWISSPDRSDHKVGWSRLPKDLTYLQWNQDNTGSGVESVLIDIKSIKQDFPNQKDIAIKMAAFWYSAISSGNVKLQFSLFKGGIMKNNSDFNWVNEGGREVQNITLSANTQILTTEDVDGQLLATLKFNTDTGAGSLINPDGVIGVDNPVLPEILPVGAPLKFTSENGSGVGELPIKLQLVNPVGDWFLATKGLPVASFNGVLAEGVTSTSSENGITLLLKNTYQDVMDYELLGHFESVTLSSGEAGATGEVSVIQFGEKIGKHMFSLTGIDLKVPTQLPTSITSTSKMFSGSSDFAQDLSTWDVSNVVDMSYMFDGCTNFDALIGGWNVSNVVNMEGMFKGCKDFNSSLSSWDVSNVVNMSYMFKGCTSFNTAISNWKPLNAVNMAHMFDGCENFDQLLSQWKTPKATDMSYMFAGCNIYNRAMSAWDVSNVTNMQGMFKECYLFNKTLALWNVSNVTDMSRMFEWCEVYNQDLSAWKPTKIPTKPVDFDKNASAWKRPQPTWGGE